MSVVAALTELSESVKNEDTPVMVECIVADIDDLVRSARFDANVVDRYAFGCADVTDRVRPARTTFKTVLQR